MRKGTVGRIAAVVVSYNRKDLLRQCMDCLLRQQNAQCDIWVIDNASTDGTKEMVQRMQSPRLHYCNTGSNLGGAGGFCFGVRTAVEAGYDAVWLMDDDTLPGPDALARLVSADADLQGQYGWLSSRAVAQDGTDQPMNRQRCTPYRDIAGYQGDRIPAVMASFVSLFLRADTIRQYGLPIAEFFIWSDDWEFTRRISRNESCYVIPQSVVVHAMRQASVVNIARDSEARLARYPYFYRNDVVLYRREGLIGWIWLLCKDVWHSVQMLFGVCGHKGKRLGIIWRGFAAGVAFKPAICYPAQMGKQDETKNNGRK